MNKQTTKETAKCQRRYASGILMYRERKDRFVVPANTTVKILKYGPKQTLVGLPKADPFHSWMTMLPNESLPAFRMPKGEAKTGKGKSKTTKAQAPVVAGEPAELAAPIAVEQAAPVAVEQAI